MISCFKSWKKWALSYLIDRAVEGGFLSRCSICGKNGEGMIISHLLYVDDTSLLRGKSGSNDVLKLAIDVV